MGLGACLSNMVPCNLDKLKLTKLVCGSEVVGVWEDVWGSNYPTALLVSNGSVWHRAIYTYMWAPHSYFTIVSLDMHLWWFLHRCSQNLSELPKLQCSSNWTHSVASDNAIYGESLTVMVSEPQWVLTVQLWCFTQMFLESHWVVTISQLWCFSGMYLQSHWVVTMQLWQIFHMFSWNHI